jgi:putative peptide zinc metalloprotease protein
VASLADSMVSSSSRPLRVRVRPDLAVRRHRYQGRAYWVIKDPVGLQYFRFEEEEFAILQMLDGQASLENIVEQFEQEFPPQTIKAEELLQFIGQLHRSGLVITDSPGQGVELKKLGDEKRWKQFVGSISNILSVRFKGIDPDRLLTWLHGYVGWFFSPWCTVLCLSLALSALALILVQFDVFQSKLPSFQAFFSDRSLEMWLLLGVVLGGTKILHEFGHGLSCKHFGGECHEMGVMLLVLTPCLYCNVSDSWMLPNRWHRAAIGAAGMYVEIVLASICTFIWWFTDDDTLLNQLCLNIMFVSSVSTILFNANPLLRYDGYYILSDILEIPNLRQKATSIVSRKLGKWCLGIDPPDDPFLPKRNQWLFGLYAVAAAIYRWVVMLSILYFLNKIFEPYGLKVLGQAIALMSLYALVVMPLVKLYKYFKVPGRLGKVKRVRFVGTLLVVTAVIVGVGMIPFPAHVFAPLVVQPRNAESVYVRQAGRLAAVAPGIVPGAMVTEGQVLAQLANEELDLRMTELEGQLAVSRERLTSLEQLAYSDDEQTAADARSRVEQVVKSIESVEKRLTQLAEDRELLTLRAPRSGVVVPPDVVNTPQHSEIELKQWNGTPLDPENIGAWIDTQTPSGDSTRFCWVADPELFEARLVITQDDIEFVRGGQSVSIILNQAPDVRYASKIPSDGVSPVEIDVAPPRLASTNGGPLAVQADAAGVPRPLSPHFDALVPLPRDERLRVGLVGTAKIAIEPRTLWQRLSRYVLKTFNFDL